MTTNVFDGVNGVIAADTRWSIQIGNWIYYTDEPIYPKIELQGNKFGFVFAGFGVAIQMWKDWIRTNPANWTGRPASKGMSVCIVDLDTGRSLYKARQDIRDDDRDVCLAGSGALYAYECWKKNQCAKTAVTTASGLDVKTGGGVHYYETKTHQHNLTKIAGSKDLSIMDVSRIIAERGYVMNVAKGGSAPFELSKIVTGGQEGLAEIKAAQAGLASGAILPDAPCNSMYNEWDAEEEQKLDEALATVFGLPPRN